MKQKVVVKNFSPKDVHFVNAAQYIAYADDFHESIESFELKLKNFPHGCFIAEMSSGEPCAYVFSYPTSRSHVPSPLDCVSQSELSGSVYDAYYIHDLCVLPTAQGLGLGRVLAKQVFSVARRMNLYDVYLVAVQGSVPFWERIGFSVVCPDAAGAATLAKYGDDARLMHADLRSHLDRIQSVSDYC